MELYSIYSFGFFPYGLPCYIQWQFIHFHIQISHVRIKHNLFIQFIHSSIVDIWGVSSFCYHSWCWYCTHLLWCVKRIYGVFFFFLVVEILGLWVSMHSGFWELTLTCFPKAIKLIYSQWWSVRVVVAPHPLQYFLSSSFDFFCQICLLFKIVKWTLLSVLHLCGSQGLEV